MWVRTSFLTVNLATVAVLLLLVGCGSATETVPIPRESVAEALRSRLESAGLNASWLASQRSDFFDSAVRRTLRVGGADCSLINLYCFQQAGQAADAASHVSADGLQLPAGGGIANVSWTGRPHFFRQGRLIALFCESGGAQSSTLRDRTILAALREVMGRQFAGLPRE